MSDTPNSGDNKDSLPEPDKEQSEEKKGFWAKLGFKGGASKDDVDALAAAQAMPIETKPPLEPAPISVSAETTVPTGSEQGPTPSPTIEPTALAIQSSTVDQPAVADKVFSSTTQSTENGDGATAPSIVDEDTGTFWSRLKQGLSRSTSKMSDGISSIFTKRKLDATSLEELEELLITADLGVETAIEITERIGEGRYDKEIDPEEIKRLLAEEVANILEPVAKPLVLNTEAAPHVILMVGVNGAGKTTTIGKLAKQFSDDGKKVHLAAGDTFRAAAIEQLHIWGERVGATVTSGKQGADAAGLAYTALEKAKAENADVLLIDTAGRLQNRNDLMQELEKITRVIKKLNPDAPHSVLLVLDATTGQNAISQVDIFGKIAGVTGLVMTKLDGTARGGILVALAKKFGLPIHAIGIGETVEDLRPFNANQFGRTLAGLE